MNEQSLIRTVNFLLLVASACIFYGSAEIVTRNFETRSKEQFTKEEVQINVPTKEEQRRFFPVLFNARSDFEKVIIPGNTMETEYLGSYFITAYCPEECGGSWSTSSGATCHYSENDLIPTTCAIDRNYHRYGEYLLIEGKVYVTEDTGPGVRGRWVDCFVETMEEVRSWPTGWKDVYTVSIETDNTIKSKKRYLYESFRNYLFMRCDGSGTDLRDDHRAND